MVATRNRIPLSLFAALLLCGTAQAQGLNHAREGSLLGPLDVQKADQLLDQVNFAFVGTVVETGASNLAVVPRDSHTTLVRVDRVLHGTPLMRANAGQVITVRSARSAEHHVGQTSTFFVDVDTFGESLAGIERGRFPLQAGDEGVHAKVLSDVHQVRSDRDLSQRMRSAEVVVAGRVVSVEPSGIEEELSEHAAGWQRATIEVATVLKGQPGTKTVTFFFPTSPDRVWKDVPRFAPGEEGVWILHSKPNDYSRKAKMIPGLTALDLKDFQHTDQSQRLQNLIASR